MGQNGSPGAPGEKVSMSVSVCVCDSEQCELIPSSMCVSECDSEQRVCL